MMRLCPQKQTEREEQTNGRMRGGGAVVANGGADMRPQRLTRSISAAASDDRGTAAGSMRLAAGSAAHPLDADALSSSSGECVELKARRQADRAGPASAAAASAHGGDAVANSLKRRRSARLNGSQEDVNPAEDDRTTNVRADGLPPDMKRSRFAPENGPPPPDDAISLHDSGSLPDPSSSQSASERGDAARGDADWSPGSPDAQSPEAVRGGPRQAARAGSGRTAATSSLKKRGSGGSQQAPPGGAIPSTHVACPICGRSVPKVPACSRTHPAGTLYRVLSLCE